MTQMTVDLIVISQQSLKNPRDVAPLLPPLLHPRVVIVILAGKRQPCRFLQLGFLIVNLWQGELFGCGLSPLVVKTFLVAFNPYLKAQSIFVHLLNLRTLLYFLFSFTKAFSCIGFLVQFFET